MKKDNNSKGKKTNKKTGKMKNQNIVRLFLIKVTDSKTCTRRKTSGEYIFFFSNVNFCSSLTFFREINPNFVLHFQPMLVLILVTHLFALFFLIRPLFMLLKMEECQ